MNTLSLPTQDLVDNFNYLTRFEIKFEVDHCNRAYGAVLGDWERDFRETGTRELGQFDHRTASRRFAGSFPRYEGLFSA